MEHDTTTTTPAQPPRSAAQIEASRKNGALSKGPKTAAGKRRSSRNATRHGFSSDYLVAMNEDPGSLAQALDPLTAHYLPADPVEEELVGQIALAQLNLARLAGIETGLLDLALARLEGPVDPNHPDLPENIRQAIAFENIAGPGRAGQLLDRYQARHSRNFLRFLKVLEDRRKPAPPRPRQTNLKPPPDHPGTEFPWHDSRNLTGPAIQARMQAALAKQTQESISVDPRPSAASFQVCPQPPGFRQKHLIYSCPSNHIGPRS
jgi:hypothetical protein